MKKYFDILKSVGLFKNIENVNLETMLKCLDSVIKDVSKNEIILLTGEVPRYVGIVLSGQINIIREDFDGNRSLVAAITTGGYFAEALCCAGVTESPVTIVAGTNATIMLLKFDRILHTCTSACAFHQKLIENMLKQVANKNLLLQNRMEIMAIKSIRGKVLRYLESVALKQGKTITIPFDRQELADYLCIERSALSHELSKMRDDGLINYKKNEFELL